MSYVIISILENTEIAHNFGFLRNIIILTLKQVETSDWSAAYQIWEIYERYDVPKL